MARKRQKWKEGDVFLLPLEDGSHCVGQVLQITKRALNSVVCSFSKVRTSLADRSASFEKNDIVAVLFTTPDQLNDGEWSVIRHESQHDSADKYLDMQRFEAADFVGVKVIGSGIIVSLMRAWFGLEPWDDFFDPNYLDKCLLPGVSRPDTAVLLKG